MSTLVPVVIPRESLFFDVAAWFLPCSSSPGASGGVGLEFCMLVFCWGLLFPFFGFAVFMLVLLATAACVAALLS